MSMAAYYDVPHMGPAPQTRTAFLVCDRDAKATLHTYDSTIAMRARSGEVLHYEHHFCCSLCGHVRRWGLEDDSR